MDAVCLPGVMECSLSYFGIKFSYIGIGYWLPFYLSSNFGATYYAISASITSFEVGTMTGGFLISMTTDCFGARRFPFIFVAVVCGAFCNYLLTMLNPDTVTQSTLSILIFFNGFFVGGASNIISSIMCADLGKRA